MKIRSIKWSNLALRVVAGLAGALVIIISLIVSEWTYFAVFFLICMFTLREFYKLVGLDGMAPLTFWGVFSGLYIYALTFFIEKGILNAEYFLSIFPVLSVAFVIKLYKKNEKKPFTNIAFTFLGVFYVAIPFSLLNFVIFFEDVYNYKILLGLLLLLWASDTGAYFTGVRFGKTKLFFRISPKKSWEGLIGGCILAITVSIFIAYYLQNLALWQWVSVALIIVVVGTYGDLVESLFKRSIEIKDSGKAIPGHGGFLDRFDGLLLAIPFIVAFLEIVRY